ncbi:carbohydrate ABC transporter permease [Atribacter laminatus]|jgi:multiple sugar transport system permease protein|uniref:Lactose transport system permease protein LacF n=1 Tax=Atribacter laminatus TaxID=2847778 RepID=A0A7T1AN94_ATRLM|nr:sugar ABC transporter permease [Atribacter laminatus]QPM69028.1 Lactose transport system permease protein LacF [Atribacter laminatus]
MRKKEAKILNPKLGKWSLPYVLVFPMVLMMAIVILYPIAKTVGMSFFENYLARPGVNPFVGLKHYMNFFGDKYFVNSIIITIKYVVITVLLRFVIGLIAALLLNEKIKGVGIARSIVVIPWAMPVVVVCLLFVQMFDYQYGIFNYMLAAVGIIKEPVKWLSNKDLALPVAMFVNIWKGWPWVAIMLLAGLQGIQKEHYEAAEIDGAGYFKQFWYVTLPTLRPVTLTVFILLMVWTIKDFDIVYVLNKGGPAHATEHITIFIYQKAFEALRMGEASAAGVLVLIVTMVFTIAYLRLLDRMDSER